MEICIDGVLGSICDYNWDSRDADVVCRSLGFSTFGKIHHYGITALAFYAWSTSLQVQFPGVDLITVVQMVQFCCTMLAVKEMRTEYMIVHIEALESTTVVTVRMLG